MPNLTMSRGAESSQNLLEEELHVLRLRFELLEGDRKAYYETSQWAIRQNKDEVGHLRHDNKELRDKIAKIKRNEADVEHQPNLLAMTELERYDQRICELHKRYDDIQSLVREKEDKIQTMRDQLVDLRREAETLKQESPYAKEIRALENRLDKAIIKYNEAQSMRKTYEQIIAKLQEEGLTFDQQLAALEKTLKSKRVEMAELEAMSRDANHSKELAKAELAKFEQQINEDRRAREKELQLLRELVRSKSEAAEKMERKQQQRLKMNEPEMSKLTADSFLTPPDEERERRMATYEEAMRQIKEATGVSDIGEVVNKLVAQGDTHSHLHGLQGQAEQRIAELRTRRADVRGEMEKLRFSGEELRSRGLGAVQETKDALEQATIACTEDAASWERAHRVLINVKAGVQHLAEKLEGIAGSSDVKGPVTDDNLLNVLSGCAEKLVKLYESVEARRTLMAAEAASGTTEEPKLPEHNCRVKLRPAEFDDVSDSDEGDEGNNNNDDRHNDVPDRESIKKQTTQLLNARIKAKQPKKKIKKRPNK